MSLKPTKQNIVITDWYNQQKIYYFFCKLVLFEFIFRIRILRRYIKIRKFIF